MPAFTFVTFALVTVHVHDKEAFQTIDTRIGFRVCPALLLSWEHAASVLEEKSLKQASTVEAVQEYRFRQRRMNHKDLCVCLALRYSVD